MPRRSESELNQRVGVLVTLTGIAALVGIMVMSQGKNLWKERVGFSADFRQVSGLREGSKKVLRRVLERYVPQSLIDRKKMGFSIPLDRWLRCELREWADDLLSPKKLEQYGQLNPEPIRRRWQEHLRCERRWDQQLWDVLMVQAWMERHA